MHVLPRPRIDLLVGAFAAALSLVLAGCGNGPLSSPVPIDDNTSDQMWSDQVQDERLTVVVYDGRALLVPTGESIDYPYGGELKEAHFYRIVADVEYLYGGVAGYDGFPVVQSVQSVEELSLNDLDLPSIAQRTSGLVRIDDYADADVLLNTYMRRAVLKDGSWVYRYDASLTRDDGSTVCYRRGVDQAVIEEGIAQGIVCCEDYFLIPA